MKKRKKTVRLTESEMVSLIENIVKQIKNEPSTTTTIKKGNQY